MSNTVCNDIVKYAIGSFILLSKEFNNNLKRAIGSLIMLIYCMHCYYIIQSMLRLVLPPRARKIHSHLISLRLLSIFQQ